MKVTFLTVPNPVTDPAGFELAYNANLATLAAAMELVVWRDRRETMLSTLEFARPQNAQEDRPTTMNGYFRWRGDLVLTSRPYNLEAEDGLGFNLLYAGRDYMWTPAEEGVALGFSISGGIMTDDVVYYTDSLPEGLTLGFSFGADGILDTQLITWDAGLAEGMTMDFSFGTGNTLLTQLVTYSNWPDEGLSLGLSIGSGTLV